MTVGREDGTCFRGNAWKVGRIPGARAVGVTTSMMGPQVEYLSRLERLCSEPSCEEYYLWPRTPLEDIQQKILERVGVTDYEVARSRSRPARIIRQLAALRKRGLIPADFSVLDVACGDGIVLLQIKRAFPAALCYGVDCNKGEIGTHAWVEREGIRLFRVFIQHLFQSRPERPFDVALMLNTYRGWESAGLRRHEQDLPRQADKWFWRNSRYTIVTAKGVQIARLRRAGLAVRVMGRGEDDSKMVCVSKYELPGRFGLDIIRRLESWLAKKGARGAMP